MILLNQFHSIGYNCSNDGKYNIFSFTLTLSPHTQSGQIKQIIFTNFKLHICHFIRLFEQLNETFFCYGEEKIREYCGFFLQHQFICRNSFVKESHHIDRTLFRNAKQLHSGIIINNLVKTLYHGKHSNDHNAEKRSSLVLIGKLNISKNCLSSLIL